MDFSGKAVLVTGAASGIGRGVAERFHQAGASVAAVDINAEGLATLAAGLAGALAITADVADDEGARCAVERTMAAFGRLDVLVNNAGIERYGTVADMAPDVWDKVLSVNLRAAYLYARHAIPHMRAGGRGGVILNISSVHAFHSWPECAAYDASKAGMIGLTRAIALDHGREGIRAVAICPGYIDTPLISDWLDSLPNREEVLGQVLAAHPAGRMGTPRDIAETVLFLASDAASFITGTTLVVDGGMTIMGH
jgi:NAD(P)-dependent dehydrogenase (short-subunit alcohol dehydrogenase family)